MFGLRLNVLCAHKHIASMDTVFIGNHLDCGYGCRTNVTLDAIKQTCDYIALYAKSKGFLLLFQHSFAYFYFDFMTKSIQTAHGLFPFH